MKSEHGSYFVNRLYTFMKQENIILNRVAVLSGIRATTLNNIVNRGSAPRIDTVYKVCNGLGISVRDFFDFSPYNEVEK
ncbi:helix-turn-helix domain-containing protein [Levilactobacillus huananensis]|uniref:helix-turn-helix domain-containing protein n=1 Tax=Levilactobacillus huananensis TaxID=2486019 RepID=UPI001CDD23FD|nr:helix-turn-helix transcriptional regulator [Levilactobacillus huananensis]